VNFAVIAAIALAVAGCAAIVFCFEIARRHPPRSPLPTEARWGCILGWLLWAGAVCFTVAAVLTDHS